MAQEKAAPGSYQLSPGRIEKLDTDKRRVWGWGSVVTDAAGVPIVDHQGDIIPPDELEEAIYEFVRNSRSADDMHKRFGVGELIECVVLTPEKRTAMGLPPGPTGAWVGFHITDDATWAAIKAGERPEFSIFGTAVSHDA